MTINPTKTPQTHLEAFLSTLPKDMLVRIAVGLNGDLTKAQIATAAAKQEAVTAKVELDAMTAEIEQLSRSAHKWKMEADEQRAKRGALLREVQNRSCENLDLTKRLREAEAALGVPFNDEWDSWSDAALAEDTRREIDRSINQLLLTKTLD
jgi:hypothetical protein